MKLYALELGEMFRSITTVLFALLLLFDLSAAQTAEAAAVVKGLRSTEDQTRLEALEKAGELVYSLEDSKAAGEIRDALLNILLEGALPEMRWMLASTYESYLSRDDSSSSAFEQALPLLEDEEEQVRRYTWMGFRQQSSQPHLTPALEDKLFGMIDHQDRLIALEALSWAISASESRNHVVGEPPDPFALRAQSEFQKRLDHPDPDVRNLSVYGVLSQYRMFPDSALEVISKHLDDEHAATRSLVLDFLEHRAYQNPHLHVLAPQVLKRFESRPESSDFPLVADAELGPAAGPPMSEVFRLARILVVMNAETADVDEYLMANANVPELHGRLFEMARVKGNAGRPLLAAILAQTGLAPWIEGTSTFMAVGLPKKQVPELLDILEKKAVELQASPENFDTLFQTTNLLMVLVKAEAAEPQRTQELLRTYFETASENARVTAIYAATVLFPGSELTKVAAKKLSETDWSDLVNDTECLLLATYNLREQSLLVPFEATLEDPNHGPLLEWLLHPDRAPARKPRFVEQFAQEEVYFDDLNGVGLELMALQLRWLIANPQPEARPGLEILSKNGEPELARLAKEALSKLE